MLDLLAFSDESKIWIYPADKILADDFIPEIHHNIQAFSKTWASHGSNLKATGGIMHNCLVVLCVDQTQAGASGCSIDESVRFIKKLGEEYQIDFFNRMNFQYLENDILHMVKASDLAGYLERGQINMETLFFDNLVDTKYKFIHGWLKPLKDSWHLKFI
ncbi:MAG: hypothetical protein IPO62_12815 [Saprospiraceae bacterium]|nr:hypothetical protein [Saprospiraceae bacterium]MBK9631923.1 hypothetical protein [Saprospiraceae bacterium]